MDKTVKDGLIKPSKSLGQNFLINKGIIKKIIDSAELRPEDLVLEIGPGTGILTSELLKKSVKVIAVEKDQRFAESLAKALPDKKDIKVVCKDILEWDMEKDIGNKPYKIVANLPYYITSPIIRKFMEAENKPKLLVLMVQKEVAKRICAKPPDMSILAVSVQFYGEPKIISYVSKGSFRPVPKVDSAILKIVPFSKGQNKPINNDQFFKIVKAGFSHPRKQLLNNFSKELRVERDETERWLLASKIAPEQRAERLTIEDWKKLYENYRTNIVQLNSRVL